MNIGQLPTNIGNGDESRKITVVIDLPAAYIMVSSEYWVRCTFKWI